MTHDAHDFGSPLDRFCSGEATLRRMEGVAKQTLLFPAPGGAVPNFGPYVIVCSIPPMEEVSQPSYIALNFVEEL